jgi:hypothetical protein
MKTQIKYFLIGVVTAFIILLSTLILIILLYYPKNDSRITYTPKHNAPRVHINLRQKLIGNDLIQEFPTQEYLAEIEDITVNEFIDDYKIIDSIYPSYDIMLKENFFKSLFVDSLIQRTKTSYEHYNPDEIIKRLIWLEKFEFIKEVDQRSKFLSEAIIMDWLDIYGKNMMNYYYKTNKNLKFDYKYRVIMFQFEKFGYAFENQHRMSTSDKIMRTIIDNEYAYLFKRFKSTSVYFKIALLLGCLIFVYGIICIFKVHFRRKLPKV